MNKLKTIAVLTMSMAALSTAFAAEQAVTESAQAAPVVQPQAGNVELDRIVAVVNNDVITDRELQERTHVVAINLRRQNIQLPPMEQLRAQVLERLIFERAIKQRARETGIRIDDQMVNASIEQIARQNNLSVDQLRQRLMADGVSFSSFREEIRDEITTQRLREREVDAKIQIPESEIDAYLAEQAGFTTGNTTEFHIQHILIPIDHPDNTEKLKKHAEEIAERLDMPVDKVREIMRVAQEPVSLETPIGEEEDSHLGDFIPDDDAPVPAEAASQTLLKEQLADVLKTLTPREEKVLRLRFGLEDGRPRTLEEVGKEFNVTRERIRQIEAKALRKLRHPSRSKKLRDFLD